MKPCQEDTELWLASTWLLDSKKHLEAGNQRYFEEAFALWRTCVKTWWQEKRRKAAATLEVPLRPQ